MEHHRPNYLDDPRAEHFSTTDTALSIISENPLAVAGLTFMVGYMLGGGRWDVLREGGRKVAIAVGQLVVTAAIDSFQEMGKKAGRQAS
jgi:hypothetical protein